jgi:glycosyltransferase involved in cell wall biosynthesis
MPVRRTRILFVDHVSKVLGGAEMNLLELLETEAAASQWESHVACPAGSPLDSALRPLAVSRHDHQFAPTLNELRIVGRGLRLGAKLRGWREVRRASTRLLELIEALRPDAVISCTNKDHFAAGAAASAAGIPSIWWVNDILSADFFPWPVRAVFSLRARRLAQRLAPVSHCGRRALIQIGVPPDRCVTIHNGIPLQRYRRTTPVDAASGLDSGSREPVFGIAGRITPWKGQMLFLEIAAAWVRQQRPGQFVILGRAFNEDAPYQQALKDFIQAHQLGNRVKFLEFQADMASALSGMDVLLHCSTRPEPFGRVLIEAMAVGIPVIAARAGGVPEIITDGVDGLLAEPGNLASYLGALERMTSDPALQAQLVREGHNTVAKHFGVDRVVGDFAALLDSVVPRKDT